MPTLIPDIPETQEHKIERLKKIIQVLMDRAEHSLNSEGSDFSLFQTTVTLEEKVRQRTRELHDAMDQLALANKQLDTSLTELKKTQNQLVESRKMAALGGLVAGVAHEINTPAGIAVTAASLIGEEIKELRLLLQEEKLSRTRLDEFLNTIGDSNTLTLRNLQRVSRLVKDFKEVAVNQSNMEKHTIRLDQLIRNTCQFLQPNLTDKQTRLNLNLEKGVYAHTYSIAIEQIITNLITNSLEHGFQPEHLQPAITIESRTDNNNIQLIFSDNGQGIAEEIRERIFEPFYTTRRGQGGTGLGLHITYNLVTEILQGQIEYQPDSKSGARFCICFPFESSG
ncbi:sensor histidine kinase [Oceanospirillum sediminis]|uniref:histidine kinase n=1 Tax=Oceanospirillum sediminis TaxID=2760088 RepID=A0A839IL16_9GAMM|nr:ATP-binding protein [Oceanospirillum sediminis]MBB1485571.1 hypothetical protein [Oceanospirillum sediminis]